MGGPAHPSADDGGFRPLDRRAASCRAAGWVVGAVVLGAVLGAGVAVALSAAGGPSPVANGLVVGAALAVVVALVGALHGLVGVRRFRWALTDDGVVVVRGVVVHEDVVVPYRRIQQVSLSQGPVQELFGLWTVELETAAGSGLGLVSGVSETTAREVRTAVLARIGLDDGT